jgi:P-type Ca2+ transporter type 2C
VETLGSVTVICSDKTGTLTQNLMTVTRLVGTDEMLEGVGDKGQEQVERLLLMVAVLCNDAVLKVENGEQTILGDPTEGAFITAAAGLGIYRAELEQSLPRIAEIPFDSVAKRMITVHGISDCTPLHLLAPCPSTGKLLAAKGALDTVLGLCSAVLQQGTPLPLTEQHRQAIQQAADNLSDEGQRVLALAQCGPCKPDDDDRLEALAQEFTLHRSGCPDRSPPAEEARAGGAAVPVRRYPAGHDHRRPPPDRPCHCPSGGD